MLSWAKYILKSILKNKEEYWCPMWLHTLPVLNLVFFCSDKHAVPFWTSPVRSEVSAETFVPLSSALSICLFIWMIPVCGMRIHPAWISGRMRPLVNQARQSCAGCFLFQNLHGMDVFRSSKKKSNVNSCKHSLLSPVRQYLTILLLSHSTHPA